MVFCIGVEKGRRGKQRNYFLFGTLCKQAEETRDCRFNKTSGIRQHGKMKNLTLEVETGPENDVSQMQALCVVFPIKRFHRRSFAPAISGPFVAISRDQ